MRQAGFAQIGVASRDSKQARKIADRADAKPGIAATPAQGGRLEESMGEAEYSDAKDFKGTLAAANIPDPEANYFERRMRDSKGMLVTVQSPAARSQEALRCLAAAGGDTGADAASEPEAELAESANVDPAAQPVTGREAGADLGADSGQTIYLHGELLKVHRERVQRGEVRVRKEVVTEPRTVEVPVSHEEIVMERTPADANTPASAPIASGQEVRIPLTEEHTTVSKEPVTTEKVTIGKRIVEGVERIKEELKHEELKVENEVKLSAEELAKLKRDRAA